MIVFLTGAGISVPSGLPTYRGPGGLYTDKLIDGLSIEQFLTEKNRRENPAKVQEYIDGLKESLNKAEPNYLHETIANVYRTNPGKTIVITQNIDNLHEQSGIYDEDIYHLHGTLDNPVLFGGEIDATVLYDIEEIASKVKKLIIIGTTLQFEYLIDFVRLCQVWGAEIILLDTDPDHWFREQVDIFESDPTKFEGIILNA